jgi:hypothetical protein
MHDVVFLTCFLIFVKCTLHSKTDIDECRAKLTSFLIGVVDDDGGTSVRQSSGGRNFDNIVLFSVLQ